MISVCVWAGEREPCASVNEIPSVFCAGGGCSVPGRGCLLGWSQWSAEAALFCFYNEQNLRLWGPHVQGQWHNPLWTEDLPPGEDPIPRHLVLTASLEVFDLGASLAALKPWHKLLLNFLLFLPIL